MIKRKSFLLALICILLFCGVASAQTLEAEDTYRVRTRAVFLDALVRDRRSGSIASDLKQTEFEVLADGKPREITYFSREGDAERRPLALVLILDLNRIGAGRFLRRTDIIEAIFTELAKLPSHDEVAIMALNVGGSNRREWLTRFTRDRAQIISALSIIPMLVAAGSDMETPDATSEQQQQAQQQQAPTSPAPQPEESAVDKDDEEFIDKEPAHTIRTVNKDGSISYKTINKDGALVTKTVNPDGSDSVDTDYGFEFSAAIHEGILLTIAERPNSQAAMVWLSDGIDVIEYKDRDQAVASLIQTNMIYSSLVAEMKTGFKLFKPVLKPLGNWVGISIYGTAQHVAKETGGEVVRVRRPEDYAKGLAKIIGNLTGRYSLGFTLAEDEHDDGQMHALEVRVKARDVKGKERKLDVISRRGFFMPTEDKQRGVMSDKMVNSK